MAIETLCSSVEFVQTLGLTKVIDIQQFQTVCGKSPLESFGKISLVVPSLGLLTQT